MPTQSIGENSTDDVSGLQDTYMDANTPNTKYNDSGTLLAYGGATPKSILVRYTGLDFLPEGIEVEEARFLFWKTGASSETKSVTFRRVLRPWYILGATWNEYDAAQAWTTPGCLSDGNDRAAIISETLTESSPLVNEFSISNGDAQLKQDIEDMINGVADNNGWIVERASTDQLDWRSSEALDGQRPKLRITYRFKQPGARVAIKRTVVL